VVDSPVGRAAVLATCGPSFGGAGLEWLAPIGFNNTYALLMRGQQALKAGIVSVSIWGGI
jgi:osmoprotectant transport system permease protein